MEAESNIPDRLIYMGWQIGTKDNSWHDQRSCIVAYYLLILPGIMESLAVSSLCKPDTSHHLYPLANPKCLLAELEDTSLDSGWRSHTVRCTLLPRDRRPQIVLERCCTSIFVRQIPDFARGTCLCNLVIVDVLLCPQVRLD